LHAQKLESLGVLAGGIAHDFNNLLAIVLARAELSLKDRSDPALVNAHVSIIRDTVLEARMLTRQLLSYAGKGKVLVELLDLNHLVTSMAQLLRASVSKGIRLELDLCANPVAVQVDVTQMRQVILNLLTNAAEAIHSESGNIWMRTGFVDVAASTGRSLYAPSEPPRGTYAFLEVEDDGMGISEETRGRLYDPFFTTKFAGRGLGLAAVLGIVKSHNGAILLDTRPGRGSRFRVLLPAEDVAKLCEPTPNTSYAEPAPGEACVLVVDDEAPVRVATAEVLRSLGYRVYEADSGVSACQVFRQHMREIDIVLLDLAMPEMNGEQTLRQLKELRSDVRVILLTAYAEDEFRVRFLKGDLAGFLTKPFARDELIQVLRTPAPQSGPPQSGPA
ncbi:MAG TPA: response regulator, partial [Polyangiaceae bacterium]|nr:response regulator [Polyangiaceae bacterium]